MSTNIDTVNTEVTLGGDNLTRCRAQFPFDAPAAGCVGIRVALRPFWEDFTGGAKAPWSVQADSPGVNYVYTCGAEHGFALGFTWGSGLFPEFNTSTGGNIVTQGYLGPRGGRGYSSVMRVALAHNHNGGGSGNTLGTISNWMHWGGTNSAENVYNYWSDLPCKAGGFPDDSLANSGGIPGMGASSILAPGKYAFGFPATRAEGQKYTLGIELVKSTDFTVRIRWFASAGSLTEASLMNVFSNYDYVSSAYPISRSTTIADPDDAFYTAGVFTPPTHFVAKFHAPSGNFVIGGFKYAYLYD
jgi:hypothetical protein